MKAFWTRDEIAEWGQSVRPAGVCLLSEERVGAPAPGAQAEERPLEGRRAHAEEGSAVGAHLRLLNELAAELVAERRRVLRRLQPELLELVMSLVEQVVGERAQQSGKLIEHTLRQALEVLGEAAGVRVHLHPDDLALLNERCREAGSEGDFSALALVADEQITRGGCRLESERGSVDATLETQLQLMREMLYEGMVAER